MGGYIMKKVLSLLLIIVLLFAFCASASALELPNQDTVIQGRTLCADSVSLWDNGNYVCITLDHYAKYQSIVPCGPVQKHIFGYFTHQISDRNGRFVANFSTTVTGEVTSVDATIVGVTGSFSNQALSGLSYSSTCSGNRATVYIKLNGATIGSLGYKISLDGTISEV